MQNYINIHEAKTHFSQIIERVANGEEVIIAKAGKPVGKIIPFVQEKKERKPGSAKGKIWISDDFNDPLPEDELRAWEGDS